MLRSMSRRLIFTGVFGTADHELLEELSRLRQGKSVQVGNGRGSIVRFVIAEFGNLTQAVPAHRGQVDGGRQGVQSLVGADVGRGPLPPDVLLARLQGQDVAGATLRVGGSAHQTAGHLADVLLLAAEQTQVRPAKGRRYADGLSFPGHDVRAKFARRLEHPHGQGISRHHQQGSVVVGSCGQAGEVVESAVEVGVLRHHARRWLQ